MKTFNLIKSLTKNLVNSNRLLILCLSLVTLGVNDAWGTYYGKFSVAVSTNSTGKGDVYAATSNTATSGEASVNGESSKKGGNVTAYAFATSNTGYQLQGWSKTNGQSDLGKSNPLQMTGTASSSDGEKNAKDNGTWYATFTTISYKISYNGVPSGVSNPNPSTYNIESETITFSSSLTRTGYTFSGWNPASIAKGSTGDKSTTASWIANQYNVTYDAQGGLIGDKESKTIQETYDGYYTCPTPTRDGYDFQGWFTEQNGKGTKITTNSTVKTAGTHTLYAHWQVVNVVVYPAENKTVNFTKRTETLTTTLAFPVDNATSTSNFNKPSSSNAEWTATDYSYSNNVVTVTLSFTATENVTTHGDHSSTITLTGKNGASATGQVTAHVAMTPILTDNVPTNKLVDDAAIDLNTLWTSTSNGAKTYTIKTWMPDGGAHNGGAVEPAINGSTLSLGDAGTLVLQLSQAEGTSSEAKTAEHTLTINRRDNHISINGNQDSYQASIFMDAQQSINLTATNTDYAGSPITATPTAGNTIATLNAAQTQVTSNYNLGDATWTVSQPENYKYKAANATFTIHVVKQAETTDCYVATSAGTYWAKLGNTTDALTWADQNAAKELYFKAAISTASMSNAIQVQQYVDGSWNDVGSKIDGKDNYPDGSKPVVTLSQEATGVRWKIAGTLGSDITNIKVTRATYLNASDFTINTQSDNTTLIYPGKIGTGSFHVDYSLANGGDLKIVCDNPKFTIDKTTQTNVDCKTGSFDVKMTYTSQTAGTDYAHVVIYNNVYRKEITVIGITQKHQQTLKWKDNFDQMSLGQEVNDAASSSHGAVTYTSYNTDVIRVDNGTTLVAVKKGEAKIKATAAGDDEYAEISIEKTISVTEKCVQYIVWTQSLMGLKLGDPNRTLNAYATSEIEECTSNNGGRLVTYTSADESVVKVVNTNELQIVGVGTTTVTAHQAGGLDSDDHEYEPATKENTVVVKDPSAKCEAFVYEQNGDAEQFFQMSTSEITGTEHTLSGEPAKITFRAKREYWNLAVNYSKGNIVLDAYTPTGGWQQVLNCGEPPIGSYREYSVNLNRDVTKIRFRRPSGGQGYHYIADAKVEMLRYIETSTPSTFQANVGEQQQQTIYLSYSNITSDLLLSMASGASSHFSVDKTQITGDCGDVAKNVALTISYAPTKNTEELGEETETLIISDGTTTTNVALKGTANRVARSIVWNIDDKNTAYTVQTVNLNATAETYLHQAAGNVAFNIVSQSSTEGCGSINNNVLSFAKAGNVSVVATTIEDVKYLPAVAVTKSWTINITPTEIVTNPQIDGEIVYGAQLSDLKLKANTGAACNTVNQQSVEGTFSITSGDISSAGEKTITVTFTPANTDMYASCTKDITVTVQKAQPDAHAHASDIIYGAAVQTSTLTNEGSTEGTWSWTDAKKDQVLNVGTHEGLAVHFTPTDKTNYNEIDGTVSLAITAVTPELTWTAKPETAQVHEVKTFTASSTNTDNTAAITYSITDGTDCASINASTGEVTMLKAGTITVQASQAATTNFNAATSITTTCTISKAPTEITTEPQIDGEIVYGAQLNDIKLKANTGAARNTVNQQSVEGTFAITGGDLSAAGEKTITVTFTPANTDMYASCTKDITITVQKAQPDAIAHASDIIYGAAVQTSILTNEGSTEGTWSWTDEKKGQVLNVGTYEGLQVHFTPTDKTNYNEIDGTVSLTINAPSENKFTNAAGDNDWNNPSNWSAGLVPDKAEAVDIVVSGELNIEEEVVVGSLTIEDGGSVNVLQDGNLTIQAESGISDQYGDLYVKNGGDVTLNGTLNVHDFVIESSIGTADGSSKSGQITNAEMLQFNDGDAYIDINLDPSGSVDDAQWYGFTVPFEVDIATGIYRKESNGSFKQLKDKTNFDIMQYNPAKRLTTGKGWEYYHGVLYPGKFYFLAIDGTNNVYRFRKKAGAGFTTEAQVELHTNGEVGNPNANWNPVGNPSLRYTTTDYEGFVQVYKNGKSAYLTIPANEVTYVVGCPFFVQAQEEGSLMLETSDATEGQFYAPRRMTADKTKNQIQLLNQGKVEDQIFIITSEDATSDYKAGSDLLKAGVSTRCGQMWLNAYGEQLSVQEAPLQENKAIYYMSLYAPKAGEYMLHVNSSDESAEIYLISDGAIIWNLSDGDYPISLSKGTTNKYGLVFQRTQQDISTDTSSPLESKMVDKIIHHEQMFIFHEGQLHNANGVTVK